MRMFIPEPFAKNQTRAYSVCPLGSNLEDGESDSRYQTLIRTCVHLGVPGFVFA
jgi:hypothetical protein